MIGNRTAFLLSFGSMLVSCSQAPLCQYHYISTKMTWPEAQQYCRQHYSDLATFESMEEVLQLQFSEPDNTWAWIGLSDDPSAWKGVMGKKPNSWRWSATGDTSQSGYQSWRSNDPDYRNRFETCVLITNGVWTDSPCDGLNNFVCLTESEQSKVSFKYINISSTWSDAQAYCRQHHTDLAAIESSSQNTEVNNIIPPNTVAWIGLYRVPWVWSDHSLSSFRNWRDYSPNYPYIQHCVETDGKIWDDDYCTKEYGMICQTVVKKLQFVRGFLQTGADLTLPENNAQILQQLDAALRRRGWTGFKLTWRIKLVKQDHKHKDKQQCSDI